MSQAGILTSQNARSQRKNAGIETFKSTLKTAGVVLSTSEEPNVLTQEQALVVRDLEKQLQEMEDTDDFEHFMQGFKLLCKKDKYFKRALLPSQLRKPGDEDEEVQESLMRIFLKVNHVHQEAMDVIVDQITAAAPETTQDNPIRLLLNQLRYLPLILDACRLATKLLDILEIASLPSQMNILEAIPNIIPDSEYRKTAGQLTKLLYSNKETSSAIIDCLNALNLDLDLRSQVQEHILTKILTGTSVQVFPVLVDFLLADYKSHDLVNILMQIRTALDDIMGTVSKTKEDDSAKIVIFSKLQNLAKMPRVMFDSWITVITTIKLHTEHKPVDLLVLFMLHGGVKMKKRAIEALIRKRVKNALFKCSLLEQLFAKYLPQQLVRDYFQAMMEIGSSLLRSSNEMIVVEFASTLIKLLFGHKFTPSIYRQEILDTLILMIGASSDKKNVTPILKIITDLVEDISRMRHHTAPLMRLLEKLNCLELKDCKVIFEILCTLICSDDSLGGLKDEIHMIVRKQLSSCKRPMKQGGIIAAVVLAKHIALTNEDQSEVQISDDSILSLNSLTGSAKEAAALLEMVGTITTNRPEFLGLYYDQLASMLLTADNLDKHFSVWLYETMTNDFQTIFVTEKVCEPIDDLEFAMQYNLNSQEEMDCPLAINVGNLALKAEATSILMLAPHFRLLRLLHYRQHAGDLSSIDALLGCSVVMPKVDNLDSLDSNQVKQVADCLFHCINWFRELISGFVTQKSKKLRNKVVQRLDDLIELEQLLRDCLSRIAGHELPPSYFGGGGAAPTKKIPTPKKDQTVTKRPKKKLKPISDETATQSKLAPKTAPRKKHAQDDLIVTYREIDTDVLRLLKYPLATDDDITPTSTTTLNLNQLNFILKDFSTKLSLLTTNKNLGLSHLTVVSPEDFVTDCVIIFPNLNRHLVAVISKLDQLLTNSDGCHDAASLFTPEALSIKHCLGLIIECLSLLFNWSGFQHCKKIDLLRDILRSLRPADLTQSLHSANRLVAELVGRLCGYVNHCLRLGDAVNLVKTLEALYSISPSPEVRKLVVTTSGKFLERKWYNNKGGPDGGKNYAANVDVLVKSYLSGANVKTLCGLVATLQKQAPNLKEKTDRLEIMATIDKLNFYILYRNLWAYLYDQLKAEIQSLTNNEHLILWRTVALTMQGLMTVAKAQQSKSNLVCFLKKSIAILKLFLSHGIPIMEIMLRKKPDEVVEILKTIQTNTRFLHHLCCQSKLTKDRGIVEHIPQFRLTVETLVYRVKAVLVGNGCSDAFWMGNLKNRDLEGEDILSQSTTTTTGEVTDSDHDELPEDDDSDDEIFNDDSATTSKSSEIYD